MLNKDELRKRNEELFYNKNLWIDPYDSEEYSNKVIRKIVKALLFFFPEPLYKMHIVKNHLWSENYELIGKNFLDLNEIEKAEKIYKELLELSDENYYWGLPIDWKSGIYIFPRGEMMSTTTAEIALFFLDLKRKSNIVENEVLIKIAHNLLYGLNVVYEDDENLILGYTAYDQYRINNSNLLVAAALYRIGKEINDIKMIRSAIKITNSCIKGISKNGGVPYLMNGDSYDSYHQVFSLRALYYLKEESKEYEDTFLKGVKFLQENLMDSYGNVYLNPSKRVIDMQGAAEAMSFFLLIGDKEMAMKIKEQIDNKLMNKKGNYFHRKWENIIQLKSRTLFTRQGELRLINSLIRIMGD